MGTLLLITLLVLVLDTAIGNRIFPGKTGVVEYQGSYKVYKVHRILGIPFKLWLGFSYTEDRIIMMFDSGIRGASGFVESTAIDKAKLYSNKRVLSPTPLKEVWNNRQKNVKTKEDIEVLDLLGNAIREDNEPEIIRLSQLLKSK